MFDSYLMPQDYRGHTPDRILIAQLDGTVRHHARWRELTEEEESAAVAELRDLAAGRIDLLAEVAGVLTGASEGELEEPRARAAAQLCIAAGADPDAIEGWIAIGRARRENARRPPFSGGLHFLSFAPGERLSSATYRSGRGPPARSGCGAYKRAAARKPSGLLSLQAWRLPMRLGDQHYVVGKVFTPP
jgi:hypothetical protein